MRDLLSQVLVHCDQQTVALSSDATSDGAANSGDGVSVRGYERAIVLASFGVPTGTSDNTGTVRLQHATIANIASDCADSDYANFSTDVTTGALAFATSDLAAGEGIGVLDVNLARHDVTDGCIRVQMVTNGTSTSAGGAWILLYRKNGLARPQEHDVVSFP